MPVIKRYPNRKLYDTEAKRYVTLDPVSYTHLTLPTTPYV